MRETSAIYCHLPVNFDNLSVTNLLGLEESARNMSFPVVDRRRDRSIYVIDPFLCDVIT